MNEKNQVIVKKQDYLEELSNTQQLCNMLMKTPHYAKMGPEGIFAVVETSKSLGVDPRQALGGGLYYVKGKVEMSSRMMNALIRSRKHSITRDKRSDDTKCILHGRRADNGDTWTESFSLDEAKQAGLTRNPVWKNFTRDMLFARALSRLARQLFPDIIGNCYAEGEISLDANIVDDKCVEPPTAISVEHVDSLSALLEQLPEYKEKIIDFLKDQGFNDFSEVPKPMYDKIMINAKNKLEAPHD